MIEIVRDRVNELTDKYDNKRENLLCILEELGQEYGFLDETIVNEVARAFNISQTEVFSVASFYHFLNTKPIGKYVIRLCRTITCDLAGKDKILSALESELDIKMGETTHDKKYTLDYANCMGMCDKGSAMMVNDDIYDQLTPSRAVEIIKSYK
ncbi:MAG: NADH-quinone oxidoreductase subunit NuoE [Spirochaetes bacterium]|nr:NADH-quinone oxidoreductase subunit NuoE [Spirochaetota bacterium]